MRTTERLLCSLACLLLAGPAAGADVDDDDIALTELVKILRDQGVLDEQQYETLSAKAAVQQEERSWLDRIEIWGSLRSRWESFYYLNQPATDQADRSNRQRLRYRLLLNLKGEVNEYADVFLQLATGNDSRSGNNSLGDPFDFAVNGVYLQYAYARFSPFPDGAVPDTDGSLFFYFGKTPQPWRWAIGPDFLLWDGDISPAGLYADGRLRLTDDLELYTNAGFFVIDENSSGKDPMMTNLQLGLNAEADERFDFGGRATWFSMFELDDAFYQRGINGVGPSAGSNALVGSGPVPGATSAAGNIPGGLSDGSWLNVIEFGLYARARLIDRWPILFFSDFSKNVNASRGLVMNPGCPVAGCTPDENGLAWMVGFDIGDSREYFRFRMLYAWLEANAFPAQFVDDDLFDAFTNSKGFYWDLSRQLTKNIYANFEVFYGEAIGTGPGYLVPDSSPPRLAPSHRVRTRANVVWSF